MGQGIMVDSIRNREVELMIYLRNNVVDPSSRLLSSTDTMTGNGVRTVWGLSAFLVKSISSVTVAGVPQYPGRNYTVAFGEGSTGVTNITFLVPPPVGSFNISVTYLYGSSMIYEGAQRDDATLPRIAVMFMGATPEFMSIGEDFDGMGGNWCYMDVQFTAEIRSSYAKQMKDIVMDFANKVQQFRQQSPQPYLMVNTIVNHIQSYDFDNELRVYRGQVSYTVRYLYKFK